MSASSSIDVIALLARLLVAGSSLFLTGFAQAQPAAEHGIEPWTETLVSVADFEPATRLFRIAGGWRLVRSGDVEASELAYWQLADEATGRFELWCAPQADTGCIRFVRFGDLAQQPVRPAARPWDSGGIYSIMVRSDDVPQLYEQALELGWWAESPPIRFQFGASDLRNVVLTGPHGIHVAAYERITPDFTAFPVGRISQGFNSMRMVRDRATARDFYRVALGFGILFDSTIEPREPAFSNLSIPLNLTPEIERAASAMYPVEGETGRVEVMQITGFTGRDHSDRASPPNFGILSVRYPVRDLAGYRTMIEAKGIAIAYSGDDVAIAGLGEVDLFAVRDPDGNLTEFYSDGD